MPGLDEPSEDYDRRAPKGAARPAGAIYPLAPQNSYYATCSDEGLAKAGIDSATGPRPTHVRCASSDALRYFIHLSSFQSKIPTYSGFVVALLMSLYLLAHQLRFD